MNFKIWLENYYAVLEVRPSASKEDITANFRRLVRDCHPDVDSTPVAKERFTILLRAYNVLSNPQARNEYDMKLRSSRNSGYRSLGERLRKPEHLSVAIHLPAPHRPLNGFHYALLTILVLILAFAFVKDTEWAKSIRESIVAQ